MFSIACRVECAKFKPTIEQNFEPSTHTIERVEYVDLLTLLPVLS